MRYHRNYLLVWKTYLCHYMWNITSFKCPPRLLWVEPIRNVQFSMTLAHKSGWIWQMARVMLAWRTPVVCGLFAYSRDLTKAHKKKFNGVKSHDLGGQFPPPPREMTMPSNRPCRISNVAWAVWHVAPSCWNHMSLVSRSFN